MGDDRTYNRETTILGGVPLRDQDLVQLPRSRCPCGMRLQRSAVQVILDRERQGKIETFELSSPAMTGCDRSDP